MDVRNCKSCGRLFNYMNGAQICPTCKEGLEKSFEKVKEYIYQNPKASIGQVAEENEVSVKQLRQWIREERLVLTEASVDGILCEHCGVPICSGRFCDKCKAAMANTFEKAIDKPKRIEPETKQTKDGNRMRFLQ